MTHDTPTLTALPRHRTGSRYARRLRQSGQLPAVIYGHKSDPLPVSIDEKDMLTLLHHGTHVMKLNVEGGGEETCLIKDLQFGYLGDNVIHVDFARVALACNYRWSTQVQSAHGVAAALAAAGERKGPGMIHVRIRPGSMSPLGRPTIKPPEVARRFKEFLAS